MDIDVGCLVGWCVVFFVVVYEWVGFDEDIEGVEIYWDGWGVMIYVMFVED